jgi:hypothetical protein
MEIKREPSLTDTVLATAYAADHECIEFSKAATSGIGQSIERQFDERPHFGPVLR